MLSNQFQLKAVFQGLCFWRLLFGGILGGCPLGDDPRLILSRIPMGFCMSVAPPAFGGAFESLWGLWGPLGAFLDAILGPDVNQARPSVGGLWVPWGALGPLGAFGCLFESHFGARCQAGTPREGSTKGPQGCGARSFRALGL